jgi:hypothetical protein
MGGQPPRAAVPGQATGQVDGPFRGMPPTCRSVALDNRPSPGSDMGQVPLWQRRRSGVPSHKPDMRAAVGRIEVIHNVEAALPVDRYISFSRR